MATAGRSVAGCQERAGGLLLLPTAAPGNCIQHMVWKVPGSWLSTAGRAACALQAAVSRLAVFRYLLYGDAGYLTLCPAGAGCGDQRGLQHAGSQDARSLLQGGGRALPDAHPPSAAARPRHSRDGDAEGGLALLLPWWGFVPAYRPARPPARLPPARAPVWWDVPWMFLF